MFLAWHALSTDFGKQIAMSPLPKCLNLGTCLEKSWKQETCIFLEDTVCVCVCVWKKVYLYNYMHTMAVGCCALHVSYSQRWSEAVQWSESSQCREGVRVRYLSISWEICILYIPRKATCPLKRDHFKWKLHLPTINNFQGIFVRLKRGVWLDDVAQNTRTLCVPPCAWIRCYYWIGILSQEFCKMDVPALPVFFVDWFFHSQKSRTPEFWLD